MHVCLSAHTLYARRSSVSWEMALEVKWPVEPYLQPEPLRKKRKSELLNKRPLLCTNSIHPSSLAEWLFNCQHLDALTLVLSTAMSVLAQLWRGDKGLQAHEPTVVVWNTHICKQELAYSNTVDILHRLPEKHNELSFGNTCVQPIHSECHSSGILLQNRAKSFQTLNYPDSTVTIKKWLWPKSQL